MDSKSLFAKECLLGKQMKIILCYGSNSKFSIKKTILKKNVTSTDIIIFPNYSIFLQFLKM